MTTVLAIAQNCGAQLGLPTISALAAGTSNNVILLKQMIQKAAQEVRDEYAWPELQREHTFTLATDTASYALPGDLDRRLSDTLWNRTEALPLLGPLDAISWQHYKSGLITSLPQQRYRMKGWGLTQFFIDPTPSSDDNGSTCVYEYITRSVFKPKTWVASTSWTGIRYCSYNGYIFDRGGTGAASTGSDNAPTPSDLTDGSITWTLHTDPYDTIQHDSDEVILEAKLIEDGAIWRFKREIGLEYESFMQDAQKQMEISMIKLAGATVVSINDREGTPMLGIENYPEGDFGV